MYNNCKYINLIFIAEVKLAFTYILRLGVLWVFNHNMINCRTKLKILKTISTFYINKFRKLFGRDQCQLLLKKIKYLLLFRYFQMLNSCHEFINICFCKTHKVVNITE